jgi:hypothetical protein
MNYGSGGVLIKLLSYTKFGQIRSTDHFKRKPTLIFERLSSVNLETLTWTKIFRSKVAEKNEIHISC